jgi:hypothetical protein
MGADLIAYIVTGPRKLKRNKTLEAKLLKQANHIIGAAQQSKEDPNFDWKEDKFLKEFEAEDLDDIADLDADIVLENLYEMWQGGRFRDTSSRVVKRNGKEFAIVVAGSESWGDEPDGMGYATLRDSIRLGFFKLLGID